MGVKNNKLIPIFALLPLILSLSSCNFWVLGDQKSIIEPMMGEFVEALNNRDKEGIKSKFQKIIVDSLDDFDLQVDALLEYIPVKITSHEFTSSGMEGETFGSSGTNQRYFEYVDYHLHGEDGSTYKIDLNYRYYYSFDGIIDNDRIGLYSLDIINTKDDWPEVSEDDYYGGCPYGYNGINIGYKTTFGLENTDYNIALYNNGGEFDPFIANNSAKLNYFYENNRNLYDLEKQESGRGYLDYISQYDDDFFSSYSLFVISFFNEEANRTYTPQNIYIDDSLVYVPVASFAVEEDETFIEKDYKGVIIMVTLPKKINDNINLDISLVHFD